MSYNQHTVILLSLIPYKYHTIFFLFLIRNISHLLGQHFNNWLRNHNPRASKLSKSPKDRSHVTLTLNMFGFLDVSSQLRTTI